MAKFKALPNPDMDGRIGIAFSEAEPPGLSEHASLP